MTWRSASILCAILAGGCATTSRPCDEAGVCPAGRSCAVDGTCRPATTPSARFARHLALQAVDWGWTRRDQPTAESPDDDTLALGGRARASVYLSFGPLPSDAAFSRAVLHLHVVDGPATPTACDYRVEETRVFAGSGLTFRSAPSARRRLSRVEATPLVSQSLLFDVSEARPAVRADGPAAVHLALHASGRRAPRIRIASPRHTDTRLRPRLELVLQ